MKYYDDCATPVEGLAVAAPQKPEAPALSEIVGKCGAILDDCNAIANGILANIIGPGNEKPMPMKEPACLSQEAIMTVERARDLMETLARIQAAIG